MVQKKKRKWNEQREIRLYQMLGVRKFRDCVFALERRKHRKDSEQNSNYHIRFLSYTGILRHYSYLSYNALIHIISILALLIHILAAHLIGYPLKGLGFFFLLPIVLNLYCIMLQRYNALRLKQYQRLYEKKYEIRIEKNAAALRKNIPSDYSETQIREDERWLKNMRIHIQNERDFLINEKDAPVLNRLYEWAVSADVCWGGRKEYPVSQGLKRKPELYTRGDLKADWLRTHFKGEGNTLLRPYAVLTEDEAGEEAFSRLFCNDTMDSIREVIDTFLKTGFLRENDRYEDKSEYNDRDASGIHPGGKGEDRL